MIIEKIEKLLYCNLYLKLKDIMGISVTGYSNVIVKPVPVKYRAKVTPKKSLNLTELHTNLLKEKPDDRTGLLALIMTLTGAENSLLDENNNTNSLAVYPDVEINEESYEWQSKENNLIHVDWATNRAFYKSDETKSENVDRSYSGMGEFTRSISLINNTNFFFPCDGILEGTTLTRYLAIMKDSWSEWINKRLDYADFHTLTLDEALEKIDSADTDEYGNKDIDWEIECYGRVYKLLLFANESGIVLCN